MGKARNFTRRAFLIGSSAVAGGVAFGGYMIKRPHANPLLTGKAEDEAVFNPWIKIDGEKITLITPHADLGQGSTSLQALLMAEEMDLEFGQFETDFGEPSAAYWNTAMGAEGAPFMATDRSATAEAMRGTMNGLMKLIGMQGTGGSSTVPDSFDKLRRAGAMARETLKLAAAQKTGFAPGDLKTEKGAVILPDGKTIAYTELAEIAATVKPVENIVLRDPSNWRLIGKDNQRLDIVAKSTGAQTYGIDVKIEGMVYAAVKTNPRQGGGLISFDASEAEKMPGVSNVFEITNGIAVIADNTWRAFQAVGAVVLEWETAPYPDEQAEHWQAVADSFIEGMLDAQWRSDGDVDGALAKGEKDGGKIIEAEYRTPYLAHAPLEPLNAIVKVSDEQVEIWTGHQVPRQLQVLIGEITGHGSEQIILHNQFMGGSFGHRLEFEFVKQAAEIANQMRGVPVKLTYSREEDFAHDFVRPLSIGRARGRVANGKVEAIDLQIASPSVIASQMGRAKIPVPGPDSQIAAGAWNNPYSFEHFKMRAYRTPELAPVSSWRSVGASNAGFHFDCFLDELIHVAGADPLEERIRLMQVPHYRKVFEALGEMSNWTGPGGNGVGRGIAFVESFGVPIAEMVEVRDNEDGIKIEKVWVAADVGKVVDPVNFDNLVKGGVVFGLGHAMNCQITYSDGIAEQENFDSHSGMRMHQCPEIFVKALENGNEVRGIGEPPVPPAAPALANAIFAATGKRIRQMPFDQHIEFA